MNAALSWNYILVVSALGWFVAQIMKIVIEYWLTKDLNLRRITGSGGMPSSHSSTVCAMTVATGKYMGVHSPVFAIAAILAIIVMYDAMGVRRETGEQAKLLNQLIEKILEDNAEMFPFLADKQLKEMIGHTPLQVLCGAILGIVLGMVIPIPG